jgi:hypothetical protein
MSFSAFTIANGVCSASTNKSFNLPTCPLLTFDMALLHVLSTSTLALLLVILSTALSPGYAASLSGIEDEDGTRREGEGLIMWELAVNSPPPSPTLPATSRSGYGAVEEVTTRTIPAPKRDKSRGGVILYAALLLVSVGVIISALVLMTKGEFGISPHLYVVNGLIGSGQYYHNDRDRSNQFSFRCYLVCSQFIALEESG